MVALAVDGHAWISGTQACLEIILGRPVAAGTISGILHDAGERASAQMQSWPMPAQPVCAATDEIHDHALPILAPIDDEHLGVLLASKEAGADGTPWGVRLLELHGRGGPRPTP